jgi:hypothetical protein
VQRFQACLPRIPVYPRTTVARKRLGASLSTASLAQTLQIALPACLAGCRPHNHPRRRPGSSIMVPSSNCPVACAVRLNQALPPSRPCSEPRVWLIQTPPGVQQPVWDVVAPAVPSAMDDGRRTMWFRQFHAAARLLLDIQLYVQAGCTQATSAFWLSLHFAKVRSNLPLNGWEIVGAAHPFLSAIWQPPRLCDECLSHPDDYGRKVNDLTCV